MTKNLYEYMHSQQERFFDDLIIFLRTQENLFEYDFLEYSDIDLYSLVFDVNPKGSEKSPSFCIKFWKEKDFLTLYSLELDITFRQETEILVTKTNFWGKEYVEKELETSWNRNSCNR